MRRSVRWGVVLVLTTLPGPIGVVLRADPIPIETAARLGAVPLLLDAEIVLLEIEGSPQLAPRPEPGTSPATGPYEQLYPRAAAQSAPGASGRTPSLEALLDAPEAEPPSRQPGWSFDPVATLQAVGIVLLLAAPIVGGFVYLLTRRRSWRRRLDFGRQRRRSHRHRARA